VQRAALAVTIIATITTYNNHNTCNNNNMNHVALELDALGLTASAGNNSSSHIEYDDDDDDDGVGGNREGLHSEWASTLQLTSTNKERRVSVMMPQEADMTNKVCVCVALAQCDSTV
jgi:hypothetical protein